ncbi:SAM-dependent methyltransferase [Parafrankia discariae]|uniref:SAM-dependent methyltransferase n=1 Tax=Parafrankia discariae TaxID=365528 RepID=UPI00035DCB0F
MHDYYLGGKDNFPADRETAEQALAAFPNLRLYARQNRAFLHRAVAHVTATAGVTQFLDIGTGIPTNPSLHETAQRFEPAARVLYVDNDPSTPWMRTPVRPRGCRTLSAVR